MGKKRLCPHCGKPYDRKDRFDKHVAKCKFNPANNPEPQNKGVFTAMEERMTKLENQVKFLMEMIEKLQKPAAVPKKLVSDIELTNLDLMELWEKMERRIGRTIINRLCGNDPRRLPHAIFEWCLGKYPLFVNLGEQNMMVHAAMKSRNREMRLKEYDTMENLVKVFCSLAQSVVTDYCTMKRCPQTKGLMIGNNEDFYPKHVFQGWMASDMNYFIKKGMDRRVVYMRDNKVLIEATYAAYIKRNIKQFTKTLANHLRNRKKKVLTL